MKRSHFVRQANARASPKPLFGEILRENEPMLALVWAMGSTVTVCPEDRGVMIATLALT